jgi:hypothetical protein
VRGCQSEVNLSTIFLTTGIISSDVGKAARKPMANPHIHLSKKLGPKPVFTKVRISDMEKDIPVDINTANKSVEYFLFIFITIVFEFKSL